MQTNMMMAGYHRFDAQDGERYGSFEVFHVAEPNEAFKQGGWYWWPCFPGYMPDGAAMGPFKSSGEAYRAAQEG